MRVGDRGKLVEGLKCCAEHFDCVSNCPYYEDPECHRTISNSVLEMLKELDPVEAKIMGEFKSHGTWWFACGACGHAIDPEDNFCRECGRMVKWNAEGDAG